MHQCEFPEFYVCAGQSIIDLWVALLNAFVRDSITKCSNDFVECFATSSSILRITLQVVKILTIPTAIPNRAFYSKGNNVGPERPLRPNNWRLWNGTLKRRSTLTFTRARNWLKSKCLELFSHAAMFGNEAAWKNASAGVSMH